MPTSPTGSQGGHGWPEPPASRENRSSSKSARSSAPEGARCAHGRRGGPSVAGACGRDGRVLALHAAEPPHSQARKHQEPVECPGPSSTAVSTSDTAARGASAGAGGRPQSIHRPAFRRRPVRAPASARTREAGGRGCAVPARPRAMGADGGRLASSRTPHTRDRRRARLGSRQAAGLPERCVDRLDRAAPRGDGGHGEPSPISSY